MATQATLETHLRKPILEMPDTKSKQTPVRFKLRLAWPAQPDAAPLAFEVGPPPDEARRQVPELSQLDL
jgi:hypothetical protein